MWSISPDTRSILDADGGIILDLQSGKFCGLNPTGARIWRALQENRGVATQASLTDALQREFEVPRCDLEGQVDCFLSAMESKALMSKKEMRKTDMPGAVPVTLPEMALGRPLPSNLPDQSLSSPQITGEAKATHRIGVAITLLGLIGAQLVLKIGGLSLLHRRLRRWPTRRRSMEPGVAIDEVSLMLNKAARFSPRRAWCLERAAVTVCWLRWRGLPAEFVIGCRRVPFASHAWAEVSRTPVNEDPAVIALYSVIDRC
jgi:hypothetical protein